MVNLAAAEGHPAAVMDVSFALQALAVERARATGAGELEPGVHPVPGASTARSPRLKLASLGVEIDTLTPEQQAYLRPWEGMRDDMTADEAPEALRRGARRPRPTLAEPEVPDHPPRRARLDADADSATTSGRAPARRLDAERAGASGPAPERRA